MIILTAKQLRAAAELVNPDHGDADQLESSVCIEWLEPENEEKGFYAWSAEYPEEGSIFLGA